MRKKFHHLFSQPNIIEWCVYHGITRKTTLKNCLVAMLRENEYSLTDTEAQTAIQVLEKKGSVTHASLHSFKILVSTTISNIYRQ